MTTKKGRTTVIKGFLKKTHMVRNCSLQSLMCGKTCQKGANRQGNNGIAGSKMVIFEEW